MQKHTYPPAGSRHQAAGREQFILSPLPLATGYAPIPQQINLKKATETYLDHGKGDFFGFEFGSRLCIYLVFFMFLVTLLGHLMFSWLDRDGFNISENFFIAFFQLVPEMLPYYIYIVGGTFLFVFLCSLQIFVKATRQVPLRFNREKRQVYAVVGKEHFIADWESIAVQIESSLLVSPQSAVRYASLVFQIPDFKTGRQATLAASYPVANLAMADWEAIRVFMEHGLSALKQQSQTPEQLDSDALKQLEANPEPTAAYYEKLLNHYQLGSVAYFYAAKNYEKYTKGKIGYGFWLLCHLVTAWTLPCHLAQWLSKKHFVQRPRALLTWSRPIPQEQWATPSQNLIEQNNQLQAQYGKNGIRNIQDYFTKHPVK